MTSVFAPVLIVWAKASPSKVKIKSWTCHFQLLDFSIPRPVLSRLTQLFLPLLPNKEGCGHHDSQQRHSGEQQKGDSSPVGVHPIREIAVASSQEIAISGVILLAVGSTFMGSASAASLRSVNPVALDCFRFERIASCQQALLRAEQLQRRASARDRYPCQTMLLGLQSDLVMVQLRAGRGKDAVNFLTAVNAQCQGF
jgi:hypothetical protein